MTLADAIHDHLAQHYGRDPFGADELAQAMQAQFPGVGRLAVEKELAELVRDGRAKVVNEADRTAWQWKDGRAKQGALWE